MRAVAAAVVVVLAVGCSGSHKAVQPATPTTAPAGPTVLHVGPAPTVADAGGGCGADTTPAPVPQAYSLCPAIDQGPIPVPPTLGTVVVPPQSTVTTHPSLGGGPTLPNPGVQHIFNGPPATCPPYFAGRCAPVTPAP